MFEFQRLHWVASITGVLEVIKQNVLTVVILLIVGSRNESPYFIWFIGLGLISAFGLGIMSWFRFKYQLLEDEIHIYKGIFIQKKLYIHKNRVQVTEISAGIIQRLFGLVSLTIQTAGGGSERAVLSALNTQTANNIVEVLNPKGIEHGGLESTLRLDEHFSYVETNQSLNLQNSLDLYHGQNPEWSLSNKRLFYLALTSGEFGIIATILGTILGQLSEFITDENIQWIVDRIPLIQQPGIYFVLFSVATVILVSYLLSILSSFVRYYGFTIRKVGKELHITRGLLERIQTTVPYNRIQALKSTEGLLRQPFGLESISIISAGHQQGQQQKSLVAAPLILCDEREAFFQQFFGDWELANGISQQQRNQLQETSQDLYSCLDDVLIPIQTNLEPSDNKQLQLYAIAPKNAFFRYLRRPNYLWLFPTLLGIYWLPWLVWLALLSIPATLYGWITYKDTELGLSSELIYIRHRALARKHIWIPKIRLQSSGNTQHIFQKSKRLYHLIFSVVSGSQELRVRVKDFSSDAMRSVMKWLHC
tara:strand:+ start:11526 stop:13130 length:1605 start_codon:yes stop_codon:yes gene_type:complete